MKWFILILFLYGLQAKSQFNRISSYELKMDSISMARFDLHFTLPAIQHYKGYRPTPKIKLTFKSRPNLNIRNSETVSQVVQEIEDNLVGVMKYDIRCKVYLTQRLSLVCRGFIDRGNQSVMKDIYSLGGVIKF